MSHITLQLEHAFHDDNNVVATRGYMYRDDGQAAGGGRPPSGHGRVLKWLKRLVFVVILLVSCEVALQIFYWVVNGAFLFQRAAIPIFMTDAYRGWSVKPSLDYTHTTNEFSVHLRTNGQGFRVGAGQGEFPVQKDASSYRVMLLGPSFAFGWASNYEDSFAAQLQHQLDQTGFAGGRKVEILNAGVPSMPPANNLNWYRHIGRQYRPDLIIQLVHGSMAVYNRFSDTYTANADGYLVPTRLSRSTWLRHTAKQLGLVFYSWNLLTQVRSRLGWDHPGEKEAASFHPGGAIQGRVLADVYDPRHPMIAEAVDFFEDLKTAAVSTQARLLVVYFPPAYNIHREDLSRWVHDGVWDIDQQIEFNRRFCDDLDLRGIRSLNLNKPLMDAAQRTGQRLYYWLDTHWTPLGNSVAASAVADYLVAHKTSLVHP